ncbi:MFS transporter [Enterococcus casseliflavus]
MKTNLSTLQKNEMQRGNGIILFSLAIGFIMATLDASIVNVALATLQDVLNIRSSNISWVVDSYMLAFASLLLLGGSLAKKYGSKRIYLIGLSIFIIASLWCGLSMSGTQIIIARFLQGVGAALFMPSSLTLLVMSYSDEKQRAKMLGLWSAIVSVASGLGPFVGGVLITLLGWRSIFLINIPIGVLGAFLTISAIKELPKDKNSSLSLSSNTSGVIMLSSFAYTLIEGGSKGWSILEVRISMTIFVISLLVFIFLGRYSQKPIIPRSLFKNKEFTTSNFIGTLLNFSMFGGLFMFGLFLQKAGNNSSLIAGIKLLPMMIVFVIGNLIYSKATNRLGTKMPLVIGLSMAGFGSLLLTITLSLPYAVIAAIYAFANLGVGIAVPSMTSIAMQSAGNENSNVASSVLNVARQIGSLIGVAVTGILFYQAASYTLGATYSFLIMGILYCIAAFLALTRINK